MFGQQLERFGIAPADLRVALELRRGRLFVPLRRIRLGQNLVDAVLLHIVGVHVANRGAGLDHGIPILGELDGNAILDGDRLLDGSAHGIHHRDQRFQLLLPLGEVLHHIFGIGLDECEETRIEFRRLDLQLLADHRRRIGAGAEIVQHREQRVKTPLFVNVVADPPGLKITDHNL